MNTQTQNAKWTVWDRDVLAARRTAAKPAPKIERVTPLVNFTHDGTIRSADTAGRNLIITSLARITELERANAQLEADYAGVLKDLAQLPRVSQTPPPTKTYPQLLHALNQADEECTRYLNERNAARAELTELQREYDDLHIEVQQLRGMRQLEQDHTPSAEPKKEHSDDLTLAYLRSWWQRLSKEEKEEREDLPALITDLVRPWHERGIAWQGVVMHAGKVGQTPAEVSPGKPTGRNARLQNETVTVNGEERGPDWGKGEAAADFAHFREERARIPKGRQVEHELAETLNIPIENFKKKAKKGGSKPKPAA